jgi:hypothetical protein
MFRSWLAPSSLLWIGGHLLLLVLGFLVLSSPWIESSIGKGLEA